MSVIFGFPDFGFHLLGPLITFLKADWVKESFNNSMDGGETLVSRKFYGKEKDIDWLENVDRSWIINNKTYEKWSN